MFSTTPASITTSYLIAVSTILDGEAIISGSSMFVVYGNPTVNSSLICTPDYPQRTHNPILCAISVSDADGPTTALASDFDVLSTADNSLSISSSDGGFTFTFFTTPVRHTSSFFITSKLALKNSALTAGLFSVVVYGNPTIGSFLTCDYAIPKRIRVPIDCTITVIDDDGFTTGVASDFFVQSSNNASISLVTPDQGATYIFSAIPEVITRASPFSVYIHLASGDAITNGSKSWVVYGHPDNSSLLLCDSSEARVNGPDIACQLVVKERGAPTTGVIGDFEMFFDAVLAGQVLTPANGGFSFTFSVPPPAEFNDHYVVSSIVSSRYIFRTWFRVYSPSSGAPSNDSTMTCSPSIPRVGSTSTCLVSFMSMSMQPTSVVSTDLLFITSQSNAYPTPHRRSSMISDIVTTDGGLTYVFDVLMPPGFVRQFNISAIVNNELVTSTIFEVYGIPTTASILSCSGTQSPPGFVHVLENVTCSIQVRDDLGPTTGVAEDFIIVVDNILTAVQFNNSNFDGSEFEFLLVSANTSDANFTVTAELASNGDIIDSPINLTLICLFYSND